jgi:hypothetical protein
VNLSNSCFYARPNHPFQENKTMVPRGKIGRLPEPIRAQVNQRLRDGQPAAEILPWLNAQPQVRKILDQQFNGEPVNDQNLTNWRLGGYADWLRREDKNERLKLLAEHCRQAAESGGDVLQGSAAVAGGLLMEVIETLDPDVQRELVAEKPEKLVPLMGALSALMGARTAQERVEIAKQRTKQNEQRLALDQQKFEVVVCEKLMDWSERPEVRKVLAGDDTTRSEKIAQLRLAIFGDHEGEEAVL